LVAAVVTGWLITSFTNWGSITSSWVAALLAAGIALVLRMLLKTVSFSD
jgi:hypothetical protein